MGGDGDTDADLEFPLTCRGPGVARNGMRPGTICTLFGRRRACCRASGGEGGFAGDGAIVGNGEKVADGVRRCGRAAPEAPLSAVCIDVAEPRRELEEAGDEELAR